MVSEIAHQIVAKVAAEPWIILLEVFQFLILVGIGWLLAVGTPKRPGIIKRRLAARRESVVSKLDHALTADQRGLDAGAQALGATKDALREAHKITATATRDADRLESSSRETVDAEAERIARRVDEALESEAEASRRELREELVEVVAQATRSVLSTSLSLPEQRDLIEKSVLRATAEPAGERDAAPPRALVTLDELTPVPATPSTQG